NVGILGGLVGQVGNVQHQGVEHLGRGGRYRARFHEAVVQVVVLSFHYRLGVAVGQLRLCHHDFGNAATGQQPDRAHAAIAGGNGAIQLEPIGNGTVIPDLGPDFRRRFVDVDVHGNGDVFGLRQQRAGAEQRNQGACSTFHE